MVPVSSCVIWLFWTHIFRFFFRIYRSVSGLIYILQANQPPLFQIYKAARQLIPAAMMMSLSRSHWYSTRSVPAHIFGISISTKGMFWFFTRPWQYMINDRTWTCAVREGRGTMKSGCWRRSTTGRRRLRMSTLKGNWWVLGIIFQLSYF